MFGDEGTNQHIFWLSMQKEFLIFIMVSGNSSMIEPYMTQDVLNFSSSK